MQYYEFNLEDMAQPDMLNLPFFYKKTLNVKSFLQKCKLGKWNSCYQKADNSFKFQETKYDNIYATQEGFEYEATSKENSGNKQITHKKI